MSLGARTAPFIQGSGLGLILISLLSVVNAAAPVVTHTRPTPPVLHSEHALRDLSCHLALVTWLHGYSWRISYLNLRSLDFSPTSTWRHRSRFHCLELEEAFLAVGAGQWGVVRTDSWPLGSEACHAAHQCLTELCPWLLFLLGAQVCASSLATRVGPVPDLLAFVSTDGETEGCPLCPGLLRGFGWWRCQ